MSVSSADDLWEQCGPRSGPIKRRASSGSKLFDTLVVLQKKIFVNVNFEQKESTGDNKSSMEIAKYHYAIAPPVSRSGSFAAFHFKEDLYESCKDTKEAPSYRLKNEFILQYQNNGSFSYRLARIDLT